MSGERLVAPSSAPRNRVGRGAMSFYGFIYGDGCGWMVKV